MRRVVLLIVLAITLLLASATAALGQVAQAGCDWYWDYTFSASGSWEYWCWDPQLGGWWYGESADGKHKIFNPTFSG